MEFWGLLIRTVAMYFIVFLIMRFMGKREIGKLSIFDLVISIMIAEIAVFAIEDTNKPMWHGIVPMLTLLLIQLVSAWFALKNRKVRMWFDGKPSILIERGKLNKEVMRKQRYNLDDLMLQLRENQVSSISDVEFAILETSGKLSVIMKTDSANGSTSDANTNNDSASNSAASTSDDQQKGQGQEIDPKIIPPHYRFEILPIPLIMEGKVQDENLAKLEKTRFWLKNILQEEGVHDFKDVFLCTIDHKGKLFVDKSERSIRH